MKSMGMAQLSCRAKQRAHVMITMSAQNLQKEHLRADRGVIVPARFADDALEQFANRSAWLRPKENRRESLLSYGSHGGQGQNIRGVGQHDALTGQCLVEEIGVFSLLEPMVLSADNIHPTLPQCLDQAIPQGTRPCSFQHRSTFARTDSTGRLLRASWWWLSRPDHRECGRHTEGAAA
jgi:hypothetical protein